MEVWYTPTAQAALDALVVPGRPLYDAMCVDDVLDRLEAGDFAPPEVRSPTGLEAVPVPGTDVWIYLRFGPENRVEVVDLSGEAPRSLGSL